MKQMIRVFLVALVSLLVCWVPVLFATYDAVRRRGSFWDCQRLEWHRWWVVGRAVMED